MQVDDVIISDSLIQKLTSAGLKNLAAVAGQSIIDIPGMSGQEAVELSRLLLENGWAGQIIFVDRLTDRVARASRAIVEIRLMMDEMAEAIQICIGYIEEANSKGGKDEKESDGALCDDCAGHDHADLGGTGSRPGGGRD